MDWKDIFYFTKTERNGIVVLMGLIFFIAAAPFLYPHIFPARETDFSDFHEQVTAYHHLLADYHAARESIDKAMERQSYAARQVVLQPFPFDPNTLPREGFLEMGMTDRVAGNIINYRRSGGSFRYREDLARIFSISKEMYAQLESYIQLPARPERESRPTDRAVTVPERESTVRFADVLIDINEADTTQWQQIRGIGPVFSQRITSYRDRLGGFHSPGQLLEVFGMDSVRFEQITPHINISEKLNLKKINLNTADFTTLVRHPYLDRNQVNSILRMREVHGPYQRIEDIKRSDLVNDELFARLSPYLTVEE